MCTHTTLAVRTSNNGCCHWSSSFIELQYKWPITLGISMMDTVFIREMQSKLHNWGDPSPRCSRTLLSHHLDSDSCTEFFRKVLGTADKIGDDAKDKKASPVKRRAAGEVSCRTGPLNHHCKMNQDEPQGLPSSLTSIVHPWRLFDKGRRIRKKPAYVIDGSLTRYSRSISTCQCQFLLMVSMAARFFAQTII